VANAQGLLDAERDAGYLPEEFVGLVRQLLKIALLLAPGVGYLLKLQGCLPDLL
jgi:hypothetical protein